MNLQFILLGLLATTCTATRFWKVEFKVVNQPEFTIEIPMDARIDRTYISADSNKTFQVTNVDLWNGQVDTPKNAYVKTNREPLMGAAAVTIKAQKDGFIYLWSEHVQRYAIKEHNQRHGRVFLKSSKSVKVIDV